MSSLRNIVFEIHLRILSFDNVLLVDYTCQTEATTELAVNRWHDVTLSGLGSDSLHVSINGTSAGITTISGTDVVLDLQSLDGPLYIGGHPQIVDVQVCIIIIQTAS